MKRAQMEVMGLAIIVIIISISMLFIVSFFVLKKPATYKEEYTKTELASNMLSTLMRTTMDGCRGMSMEEIYASCARDPSNPEISCNATHNSCQFLNSTTRSLLNNTLGRWSMGYELHAIARTEILKIGRCPGAKKQKGYPIPIGAVGENLQVTLDICDK